ncbi:MAG: electron transfer flavoprotein subunit beta/FixA family protein [Planctomycetaceae bacterium]|nr:electron transfer flavoprotein subunit beta/FixA family protein [Planctomycetaceae bacterium]
MKILVCLKQILDPEIPPRDFTINRETHQAIQGSANLVTNIFCENALETALQLRERSPGEITALTFGPASAEDSLRKALALKADQACLVEDDPATSHNSATTALVLAAAIRKLGEFDLIMVGREAGDWGAGQTGGLLAEQLGLPYVAFVDHIESAGDGVTLRRQTELGWEKVEAHLPLVVSITNSEENVPRIPKTRDIMMSARKSVTSWKLSDLGLTDDEVKSNGEALEVVDLYLPEKKSDCDFIEGDSIDEKIDEFAKRLASIVQSA